MFDTCKLAIPNDTRCLVPGNRIKLGRFETAVWVVSYGWYTWGGNRPVCGWYLIDIENPNIIKPLHLTDLDDIYFIEH